MEAAFQKTLEEVHSHYYQDPSTSPASAVASPASNALSMAQPARKERCCSAAAPGEAPQAAKTASNVGGAPATSSGTKRRAVKSHRNTAKKLELNGEDLDGLINKRSEVQLAQWAPEDTLVARVVSKDIFGITYNRCVLFCS